MRTPHGEFCDVKLSLNTPLLFVVLWGRNESLGAPELFGTYYAGFSYSGNYNGTSPNNVGSNGNYWSSSVYNTNNGYNLNFNSSNVNPQNNNKYNGNAVRCVAK